jgi:hypothetical protein
MSSKSFRLFLFVIFLLVPAPVNIFAWGGEGHEITVRIAANFLTPAARAGVIELLKVDAANNAEYYREKCSNVFALTKKNALTNAEENTLLSDGLACIASWADPPVKDQRNYTSNWHFVDIPVAFATSANPARFTYDPARDCITDPARGDCAVQALFRLQPVLGNPKIPGQEKHKFGEEPTSRADALKFFVHIVGDIHQPLHCVTDKPSKAAVGNPKDLGDLGGNTKLATWFGNATTPYGPMNLHSVWDTGFIGHTMQTRNLTEMQYTQKLIDGIDKTKLAQMQSGDYLAWIAESYNFAVNNAYGKLPKLDPACEMTVKGKKVMGCFRLSDDYYNANNSIVEQQLRSGGVRLAGLLNSILK